MSQRHITQSARSMAFFLAVLLSVVLPAQDLQERLADVLRAKPGKERAQQLLELSKRERGRGRTQEAVEYAILSSSEAERHSLDVEYANALLELALAHKDRGSIDNAIGATLRVTLVNGTYHSPVRTDALIQLAEFYLEAGHSQKALEHLAEASSSTAASHMNKARYLRTDAKAKALVMLPEDLIDHLKEVLSEPVAKSDLPLQLDLLSILATAQAKARRYDDALNTEEAIMKLAITLDRPLEAGVCANNMGALQHRLGRPREAMDAYAKGLIMVEDLPYVQLNMRVNAALANAATGSTDAALRLVNEAQEQLSTGRFQDMQPITHRTRSAVLLRKGDLVGAQDAALASLNAAKEQQDLRAQAAACFMLADIMERRDLAADAREYEATARNLEKDAELRAERSKADREAQLLRLQRVEREQVDLLHREKRKESKLNQLALDAENREKQLSLLVYEKQLEEAARREAIMAHERVDRELRLAQAALETERQDRMIQDLDKDRMIQLLNLGKLESEKKEQQRALELLEERNALVMAQQEREKVVKRMTIALAAGAALAAVWLALAWYVTRRKKQTILRQNQQITHINSELETKNRDIQSSLAYARTIQSAILPTEEDIKDLMPQSFMIYKPLDVVSGDLPFVRRVGNKIVVAAIDCTGHGIPAAMMTFIAYYGLNDILLHGADEPAGRILDRLHDHVKHTMEARGESGIYNDGFDIGLCVIDMDRNAMSFAGAQLPVLIVRNDEVMRVKGDILPLGDAHFARTDGYRTHSIELQKGDSLYLLSDGLIHQFGGDNGRSKFSMKRLTEILRQTASVDMDQIKVRTEELFLQWKGDQAQTDDVLLIGLRYAA
ncbi:MAG: SpoIIE family protein phosphatase [Flavobacteriales bacterium]|nr:SpoIIE family protein phosphatase [Flavobacteriales bacterium]